MFLVAAWGGWWVNNSKSRRVETGPSTDGLASWTQVAFCERVPD